MSDRSLVLTHCQDQLDKLSSRLDRMEKRSDVAPLTVEGRTGRTKAQVSVDRDGVLIEYYKRDMRGGAYSSWKFDHEARPNMRFHEALDWVYNRMQHE